MSEASRDMDTSAEENKIEPDYFGYYTREVAFLLSQTEDFLPFASQTSKLAGRTCGVIRDEDIIKHNYTSKAGNGFEAGSLFCDAEAGISDFKKERLKALLRQGVVLLSQEVDEDSGTDKMNLARPGKAISSCVKKKCSYCHTTETSKWSSDLEGLKSLCHDCGIKLKEGKISLAIREQSGKSVCEIKLKGQESVAVKDQKRKSTCEIKLNEEKESLAMKGQMASNIGIEKEDEEVNDDLQLLLVTDSTKVEETMKKISDELSETLGCKKQKLEELLDSVMSSYRSMTLAEKQPLQYMIQKLPPRNLHRVVEIIQRSKPSAKHSSDEIFVNMEKMASTDMQPTYCYSTLHKNHSYYC